MPDNLQHMRHVAELANDTAAFTPHAALDISANGARWLLMLIPIVERIAVDDDFFAGEYDCLFCKGRVHYGGDEVAPFVDHVEHAADCPVKMARALKEGTQ